MIVKKMQKKGYFPQYNISGYVLNIEGKTYDLEALQTNEQEIVEIKENDRFMATIIIPPATYTVVEDEEVDESEMLGGTALNINRVPLDINTVQLILWAKEEHNKKEGEI